MSKTIHIHIHRAPAKDAWEESKHKRAANGQFGSGGGAAAKPAAKSAPAAAKKPAAPNASREAAELAAAKSSRGKIEKLLSQAKERNPAAAKLYSAALSNLDKYVSEKDPAKQESLRIAYATSRNRADNEMSKTPGLRHGVSTGGSGAKPAIAVKYATSGSSALARLQAQSNAHLKKTGFGHLVTPPKNAPGTGTPKVDNPQNVATQLAGRKTQLKELQAEMKTGKYSPEDTAELKNKEASLKRMIANYEAKSAPAVKTAPKSLEAQAREHEDTAAKHHVAAQAEFKKNGKTDEYVRLKNLAQKHTNLGTDLINQAVASSKGK